jgi:hypothetical protein
MAPPATPVASVITATAAASLMFRFILVFQNAVRTRHAAGASVKDVLVPPSPGDLAPAQTPA